MAVLTTSWQKLAEKYIGNSYGDVYVRLYAKYSEQSISENKTKVQYENRVYYSGNSYILDQQSSGNVSGTGASQINGSRSSKYNKGETVLCTTEGWVEHNSDGTKSVSGSAYLKFPNWGWSGTATGSADLPTIPRATACPNLDGYIESGATIALNPASTTFKHRLYYEYKNANTNDVKTGVYPSATGFFANVGTLPLDTTFYSYTPKATGTGKLTLYTYTSEGTQIGSSSGTITIRCDKDKCSPMISIGIRDVNDKTKALTTNETYLVMGYSTAELNYVMTPLNGASISSKTVNDTTLNASPHYIYNVATDKFKISVTDSRGFTTTETFTNKKIDYVPLSLDFTAFRTTPTGSEICVEFEGNYFNGSFGKTSNTLSLSWKYKLKGASSWTNGGNLTKDTHYTISGNKFTSKGNVSLSTTLFTYTNNYEIAIYYSDKLIDTASSKIVPKGEAVLYWEDGKAGVNGAFNVSGATTVSSLSSSGAVSGTNITGSGTVKGGTVNATSNLQINGTNVLLKAYPVGSIYMSVNSTNPGTLFGGTWEQLKDRFLLGAGSTYSNGATGGSATHTLTVNEMPSHTHGLMLKKDGNYGSSSHWRPTTSGGSYGGYVTATGGSGAHNNMPPYLVVYMWKRTA